MLTRELTKTILITLQLLVTIALIVQLKLHHHVHHSVSKPSVYKTIDEVDSETFETSTIGVTGTTVSSTTNSPITTTVDDVGKCPTRFEPEALVFYQAKDLP